MYRSSIIVLIFMLIYIIFGIGVCGMVFFTFGLKWHGLLSTAATIIIGCAILMFRLLRGTRSKIVKYVHLILHTLAAVLYIISIVLKDNRENFLHAIPGYFVLAFFFLQYVLSVFFYTYVYENRKLRLRLAPLHDIFGVWLYICLVGLCLNGTRYFKPEQNSNEEYNKILFSTICMGVSYIFYMIVIIIVLTPYFEWDLVGFL